MSKSAWQLLGDYLKDTELLGSIQSTLYWDQNTSMPIAGSTWRGEHLSLLAKQLHARQSCEKFEILIKEAKYELKNLKVKDDLEPQLITDRFKNQKVYTLSISSGPKYFNLIRKEQSC